MYVFPISLPCPFVGVVKAMWKVMRTYHQVKLTHEADDVREDGADKEEPDAKFNRTYVRTKLDNGLLRVWRVRCHLMYIS